MMILNNADESKINEMFTLETRFNFNHDKDKPCLALLYSFYSPKVIKIGERNDNDEVDNTYNTDESEDDYSDDEDEDDEDDEE
jgi:Ran GTPase-activating protein (RanGAP) involved in mRNA processing and transport